MNSMITSGRLKLVGAHPSSGRQNKLTMSLDRDQGVGFYITGGMVVVCDWEKPQDFVHGH